MSAITESQSSGLHRSLLLSTGSTLYRQQSRDNYGKDMQNKPRLTVSSKDGVAKACEDIKGLQFKLNEFFNLASLT